jgi:hypothetical protein
MFGGRRWRTEARPPTAKIFAAIYRERDDVQITA